MVRTKRVKEYIKCPKCGEEAELDPIIFTSYPPHRRWRCKHCGDVDMDYCDNLQIYVHDEPEIIEDDKIEDIDKIIVGESINNELEGIKILPLDSGVGLNVVVRCEICDKEIQVPCSCLDYSLAKVPHICNECKEMLKYMIENERKKLEAYAKLAKLL